MISKHSIILSSVAFSLICISSVYADPDPDEKIPDGRRVQAELWKLMEFQDFKLEGRMTTSEKEHPIVLKTKGKEMIYEFKDNSLQIDVEMTPTGSKICTRKKVGDPWIKLSKKERLETILDSDVSYEDLGVDFLRWKNVKPLGGDSIKTLDAWAYEAKPSELSRYAKVNYWISSDYMAFLRVDAFNSKGQMIKQVEINGVQKVPNSEYYIVKEIMISTIIPGRNHTKTRTFIQIDKITPHSGIPD